MKKPHALTSIGSIETEHDIRRGVRALRRRCGIMRLVHDVAGDPPLRRRPGGFEGLAHIVVSQQLSAASAAAIWKRCLAMIQPFGAAEMLSASDETLRAAGLSSPKIRTLRAVANAVVRGGLDPSRLEGQSEEDIHAALTRVSGIGPWSADIFLMFCLGRVDAFAAGDLALQLATQRALKLDRRPTAQELTEIAERWRPWRGVAARLLWAYYAAGKSRPAGAPL
jgi:DNA-3-methyladenine glycosylase II